MLYLVNSNNPALLAKFSDLKWIYIGSYKGIERAERVLSRKNRRFIARDIKAITESVRDNFIDYIGILSTLQKNNVLWYSSSMASKSIMETSLFHQYVYQKLLKKLSALDEDLLVVTDDEELLTNTRSQCSKEIVVLNKIRFYKSRLYRRIRGYREVLVDIVFWFIYRFHRSNNINNIDVFIHSWIDSRTFRDLPNFTDPYLAELGNFLAEKGYVIGRLAEIRLHLRDIFRLKENFKNIIFPLSYLPFGDILKIVFTKFTLSMSSDISSSVQDYDILSLLTRNEELRENASKTYIAHLFLYYSYRNLALKINANASFVYPFENQPWEKMFNIGFEKFSRIAYQHSTITYNSLNYCTSRFDDERVLPKSILCAGKKWASFLNKYYTACVIEISGALRYSHLFTRSLDNKENRAGDKCILLALPIGEGVSVWLQKLLLNFLKKDPLGDYHIKIKPHPLLPEKACLKSEFADYKNCDFVEEDISRLLKESFLSITSGSTVAFESVILGIKTLYVVPEEIALSHEDFIQEDLFIAYEENFAEKLKEALRSSIYPRLNIAEYFSKPDYNVFLRKLSMGASLT